jgi:hypothetical protein
MEKEFESALINLQDSRILGGSGFSRKIKGPNRHHPELAKILPAMWLGSTFAHFWEKAVWALPVLLKTCTD